MCCSSVQLSARQSCASRKTDLVRCSLLSENQQAVERFDVRGYGYGNECLHGVVVRGNDIPNFVPADIGGATVFPQPIGLAASFDHELLLAIGDAVSNESRALSNYGLATGLSSLPKFLSCWAPKCVSTLVNARTCSLIISCVCLLEIIALILAYAVVLWPFCARCACCIVLAIASTSFGTLVGEEGKLWARRCSPLHTNIPSPSPTQVRDLRRRPAPDIPARSAVRQGAAGRAGQGHAFPEDDGNPEALRGLLTRGGGRREPVRQRGPDPGSTY